MNIEVIVVKGIPQTQLKTFMEKVVYNTAVLTRQRTKQMGAYPRLSGDLERAEFANNINGSGTSYSLCSGLEYDKYVWKMNNVQWTNKKTVPQWYYNVFRQKQQNIISEATHRALKEIK